LIERTPDLIAGKGFGAPIAQIDGGAAFLFQACVELLLAAAFLGRALDAFSQLRADLPVVFALRWRRW
jgi:hypothetical protein